MATRISSLGPLNTRTILMDLDPGTVDSIFAGYRAHRLCLECG